MDAQTATLAIIGGSLIAFATTFQLMLFGRPTEMSSIFNSLLNYGHNQGFRWKFGFFCGLITGTYGVFMIFGHSFAVGNFTIRLFDQQETAQRGLSTFGFALGGLLVGFGAKLGNGSTTEHAICGLPLLSIRSFIAVFLFMIAGVATATMRSYYPLLSSDLTMGNEAIEQYKTIADFLYALLLIYFAYDLNVNSSLFREKLETLVCLFIGLVFGLGLSISGMSRRSHTLGFLNLVNGEGWNPALGIMAGTAIGVNLVTFNLILKQKPMLAETFEIPKEPIDWKIFVGPIIFGIGWGLTGMCPGPAMINGFLLMKMLAYLPFMAAGQSLADWTCMKGKRRIEVTKETKLD